MSGNGANAGGLGGQAGGASPGGPDGDARDWVAQFDALGRELRQGSHQIATGRRHPGQAGPTSDLSIDETLLLHSIGWEPVDLVAGAAVVAIPASTFLLSNYSADSASSSVSRAVSAAVERMHNEAGRSEGAGVVGVHVELEVHPHEVTAIMVGTAVRPSSGRPRGPLFVSDLSTRDFCLLHNAGWAPVGLAFGTAFVQVPRRSARTALRQATANVELTNMTSAMYQAREMAMERMQSQAIGLNAKGMVDVHVEEGPLHFAHHVVAFTAWGTAIRLDGDSHRYLRPRAVVPVDDREQLFRVEALGGGAGDSES